MSEEAKIEQPTTNADNGSEPATVDKIEQARLLVERLEAANKQSAELLKKREEMEARAMLSGRSQLTQPIRQMTKDEQDAAAAKAYFKGSIIEKFL